jgi:hypothetical protein
MLSWPTRTLLVLPAYATHSAKRWPFPKSLSKKGNAALPGRFCLARRESGDNPRSGFVPTNAGQAKRRHATLLGESENGHVAALPARLRPLRRDSPSEAPRRLAFLALARPSLISDSLTQETLTHTHSPGSNMHTLLFCAKSEVMRDSLYENKTPHE